MISATTATNNLLSAFCLPDFFTGATSTQAGYPKDLLLSVIGAQFFAGKIPSHYPINSAKALKGY